MRSSSAKEVVRGFPADIDVDGAQFHAIARLNIERGLPAAVFVPRLELRGNDGLIVAERLQPRADLPAVAFDPAPQPPVGRVAGLLVKRQPGQQVLRTSPLTPSRVSLPLSPAGPTARRSAVPW